MPALKTGEVVEGQVKQEAMKACKPETVGAATNVLNSGAVGPCIIYLSDSEDEDGEEITPKPCSHQPVSQNEIRTRSISDLVSIPTEPVFETASPALDTPRICALFGCYLPLVAFPQCHDLLQESRWAPTTVAVFAVQCNACGKWRLAPSQEEYHAIHARAPVRPWVCEDAKAWRNNVSCDDPADLSPDGSEWVWAVDKPMPKPPAGFQRKVVIRGEFSPTFADVYYKSPCGQNLRSMPDVQRFLDRNPMYTMLGVDESQFDYARPKLGPGLQKRTWKTAPTKNSTTQYRRLSYFYPLPLPYPPSACKRPRTKRARRQGARSTPTFPTSSHSQAAFPQPLAAIGPAVKERHPLALTGITTLDVKPLFVR